MDKDDDHSDKNDTRICPEVEDEDRKETDRVWGVNMGHHLDGYRRGHVICR